MVASAWEQLNGSIVGQKYTLYGLISLAEDQAWFDAGRLDTSGERVCITCFPDEGFGPTAALNDLTHPHLRTILHAGREKLHGREVRCIAMEPVEELLSDRLAAHGPLSTSDVRQLASQVIAALEYLHRKNLVYCNLSPSTIAMAGGKWKLADFAQLREAGQTHPKRTRRFLAMSPQAPPDAYTGLITPAWDIYSLGVTLRYCLLGNEGARAARAPRLPEPFDLIVRLCLEPNPQNRIPLQELALMLGVGPKAARNPVRLDAPPRSARRWPQAGALATIALFPALLFIFHGRPPSAAVKSLIRTPAVETPAPRYADRQTPEPAPDPEAAKGEIAALLDRWISTLRELDLPGHLDCYAPVVAPFGGVERTGQRSVMAEKRRVFDGIGKVRSAKIARVRYESLTPDQAVVSLEKEWDITGANPSAGLEDERLTLRLIDGKWKIAGEEESNIRLFVR